MIGCALDSSGLEQPFEYLKRYHITYRKNVRATWSQNVRQKLMQTQKFRESQSALKKKICLLCVFWGFAPLLRFVMSWIDVRWTVLILGNLLNTLNVIISPLEKFYSHLKSKKFSKTDEMTDPTETREISGFSSVFDEHFDFRWL